jgi:hypothetical protein
MTEVILGIDPSTSTGLCVLVDGKVAHIELLKIKKPGDPAGAAYAKFADTIWAICVKFGVQVIGVETKIPMGNIPGNAKSFDLATVLYGRCEEISSRLNLELVGVAVQSWRSSFLGRTVAPKNFPVPDHILPSRAKEFQTAQRRKWWKTQALQACEQRGIKVTKDDIAEAIGIAFHVHKLRNPNGLGMANSLFDLDKTSAEPRTTLTLPGAKSEAERVFARFGAATDEE